MRLTTKIVIGFILSIFILALGFIIGFSFTDRINYSRNYNTEDFNPNFERFNISQENITLIEVKPYKTILLESEPDINNEYKYPQGTIFIKPANIPAEKNKLFIPEELSQFLNIISLNDTLTIRLKMKDLYEKYDAISQNKNSLFSIYEFNLSVNTNTVDINNNLSEVDIDIRNIKTDKVKINTSGKLNIDSCQVDIIEPHIRDEHKKFRLKNSQVKELKIDLDYMTSNWMVSNCDIEVENLTGSDSHNVELPKSEAKVMNWIPKNKDAKLSVTLRGDTARIVFP